MGKIRALGLFSGGLDSILAYKLLEDLGIEPVAVFFRTPFFSKGADVENVCRMYDIKLEQIDITGEYLREVLRNPKYGYGRFFNPCIDCHGFMVKQAMGMLDKLNAKFVFTGEVLGERPFSQTNFGLKKVMELGAQEERLLLRPLSAKLMPVTIPEEKGWVNRERLLTIKGRGRKPQFELARQYGIDVSGFLQPSGGCLLTDPAISKRVRGYIHSFNNDAHWIWPLIKTGRHFLLKEETALVIGRNKEENEVIERYSSRGAFLSLKDIPGPAGIVSGIYAKDKQVLKLAGDIILAYTNKAEIPVSVFCRLPSGEEFALSFSDRRNRKVFDQLKILA